MNEINKLFELLKNKSRIKENKILLKANNNENKYNNYDDFNNSINNLLNIFVDESEISYIIINEYNEIMLDFNAILFAYKRKKGLSNKLSFGDRKLKDFAKISLDHVERSMNYKNVIDILLEESKVNEREFNISKNSIQLRR